MNDIDTQDEIQGLDARTHAAYSALKLQSIASASGTFHLSWNDCTRLGINERALSVLRDEGLISWIRDRNMNTIRLLDIPEMVRQEGHVEVYVERVPLHEAFNIPGILPARR